MHTQGFHEILEAFKLFAQPLGGRTQLQHWSIQEHLKEKEKLSPMSPPPAGAVPAPTSPHSASLGGNTGTLTPSSASLHASATAPSEASPDVDDDLGVSTGLHAGARSALVLFYHNRAIPAELFYLAFKNLS